MAEDTLTTKAPRQRRTATRRNFFKIVTDMEAYLTATVDVLEADPLTEYGKGQVALAKRILEKVRAR